VGYVILAAAVLLANLSRDTVGFCGAAEDLPSISGGNLSLVPAGLAITAGVIRRKHIHAGSTPPSVALPAAAFLLLATSLACVGWVWLTHANQCI